MAVPGRQRHRQETETIDGDDRQGQERRTRDITDGHRIVGVVSGWIRLCKVDRDRGKRQRQKHRETKRETRGIERKTERNIKTEKEDTLLRHLKLRLEMKLFHLTIAK